MGRCVYGGIYEPGHPTADVERLPAGRAGADQGAGRDDRALSRRQFSLGLQLGRRRRPEGASGPGGSISPGEARKPTSSAPTNSSRGARRPGSSRCSRSTSARAGPTRRAISSNIATIRAAPSYSDLRRAHGFREAARHQVLVPRQRDGRPVADLPEDGSGIWPGRAGDRQGHALGRSRRRAHRLRLIQSRHADLRPLGARSSRALL